MKQQEKQQVMKEIERKTEKIVQTAMQTGKLIHPNTLQKKTTEDVLQSIMLSGADEFKIKTGETLSYSDIRQLYG